MAEILFSAREAKWRCHDFSRHDPLAGNVYFGNCTAHNEQSDLDTAFGYSPTQAFFELWKIAQ